MAFVKTPTNLQGIFSGETIYSVREGMHLIVPSKRDKPMGAVVAREVFVRGLASVVADGKIDIVQEGGFVITEDGALVDISGGRLEAKNSDVLASGRAAVVARGATIVKVFNDGSRTDEISINALDNTLVIMWPGTRPRVKLHDRAQIVRMRWSREERTFLARQRATALLKAA